MRCAVSESGDRCLRHTKARTSPSSWRDCRRCSGAPSDRRPLSFRKVRTAVDDFWPVDDNMTYLTGARHAARGRRLRSGARALRRKALAVLERQESTAFFSITTCPLRWTGNLSLDQIFAGMATFAGREPPNGKIPTTSSKASNAGADDFISKSADFSVLKERIRAQLLRRHVEEEKPSHSRRAGAQGNRSGARAGGQSRQECVSRKMSHEIRTPMNAIIGMASFYPTLISRRNSASNAGHHRQLGRRIARLLNDIWIFPRSKRAARLRANDFICATPWAISLAHSAHRLRPRLELAWHIAPNSETRWWAIPGRLRQVIVNLVGNAIKVYEQGEWCARRAQGRRRRRSGAAFSHHDTGIGFRWKTARIFEAFEQADGSIYSALW